MRFRPCIDLHEGRVKQIVGSTLSDDHSAVLRTNFSSDLPSSWYAHLYRQNNLTGGHIIMLGPGNEAAATDALSAWPGGLQLGGGISDTNAEHWLKLGASHVIVTSYVFHDGQLDFDRLEQLRRLIGKERLVLDLSCRWKEDGYYVVTDRWQKFTTLRMSKELLAELSSSCAEFLIHAVDVEGKCMGVDERLLALLAVADSPVPLTYAGGVGSMADVELIRRVGQGKIDATVGSALDIFGGSGCKYKEVVEFCR
ncbi:MAG: 1-(5-phosphoribosyl)-5-[(5-phosphoribosylamino)methylideneamino] imidazole-4-carboxamide isomerase [Candidatus Electronema aureum]|uniref:1-(5-phosphoribosyl)-5-[(5-phosphoribosylamino)methylideneamino] imidazole-4-carboxamide isomerase n=1 Tax=Candidatus Electronema aureum TaxID=2005002 RepID=A0A521G427_9BACT|nr:MAG: 1-(5-phosphoribosyl)-5-[(5-phosphoribosylamino)methylideneamino] imidazole-4-carboxamide isomerase [Candidatus Electronema aureum]